MVCAVCMWGVGVVPLFAKLMCYFIAQDANAYSSLLYCDVVFGPYNLVYYG